MLQELAPKHTQIHMFLKLFPAITALDLSGVLYIPLNSITPPVMLLFSSLILTCACLLCPATSVSPQF